MAIAVMTTNARPAARTVPEPRSGWSRRCLPVMRAHPVDLAVPLGQSVAAWLAAQPAAQLPGRTLQGFRSA